MSEILIFGGTSEGRMLAEFCAENKINACVSVTTDYGAELLPYSRYITPLNGKLDKAEITELISDNEFSAVIDATHPYATLATENIRAACFDTNTPYYRLKRESGEILYGNILSSFDELTAYLNQNNKRVLSTLGSKELSLLSKVNGHYDRIWLRLLPAEGITEQCIKLGFDREKLIFGKGPFSIEENIKHIKGCSADVLVTKESGKAGGYYEKAEAAKRLGTELITIKRPEESGFGLDEIKEILWSKK
ncbi:MAG: precorrin-6A reductase [Oscillospiraceae bacterium]